MFKTITILIYCIGSVALAQSVEKYSNDSAEYKCVECLCHAITGCWARTNCAKYSISDSYWNLSGRPTVDENCQDSEAYEKCMRDEDCIIHTIISYTSRHGEFNANCDEGFDCKDRFSIHLFGKQKNPIFGNDYANRFNHCNEDMKISALKAIEDGCEND